MRKDSRISWAKYGIGKREQSECVLLVSTAHKAMSNFVVRDMIPFLRSSDVGVTRQTIKKERLI